MIATQNGWVQAGPAPSRGDGNRVRLRCQTCGSMTAVRGRTWAKGWVRPCLKCQQNEIDQTGNTNAKEATA